MLTEKDLIQLQQRGISLETVKQQIENFKKGFPFAKLIEPATPTHGIISLSEQEIQNFVDFFDKNQSKKTILKFVPASGAASRMFKDLFAFAENPSPEHKMVSLLKNYQEFAFAEDIDAFLEKNGENPSEPTFNDLVEIAKFILENHGLNYGFLPKALIKFHKYENQNRTALEEHLVEGAIYSKDINNVVHLHFTVSPNHLEAVNQLIKNVLPIYEKTFNVNYSITFSTQNPASDTIAVDSNNEPFRDADGTILFRPAGHGALIENLNGIDADVVFIKNIDNVVPDRIKNVTYEFKKALGGYLLSVQEKVFAAIEKLKQTSLSDNELKTIQDLAFSIGIESKNNSQEELLTKLNRPIRICGMVKNEGEPGGGPFWVEQQDGSISLQIIESSQIDDKNEAQQKIAKNATHFNPVDLICGIKDYQGNKFDLTNFIDPSTGFISYKSQNGKELKAQELPGLWNGAMANWITLFVEVPVITFNPVKTINDLLREQHKSIIEKLIK